MNEFWSGKKVLVTGHTGFKGSWLSLWLQRLGADVLGYSLLPTTQPSLFYQAQVDEQMTTVVGDIRDISCLKKTVADFRPEIIFHLAAQPLVRNSYLDPVETYTTNVLGTVNILETVRESENLKVFINVTTDKCYENKEWSRGYKESDTLGGIDPYSASKACSEIITSSYRNSYFSQSSLGDITPSIATVRAGNVIGGGDWAKDRLIPDLLRAIESNHPITLRYPHAIRPWQHVLEPLYAYLLLAEKMWNEPMEFGGSWNVGPHEKNVITVGEMIRIFQSMWNDDFKVNYTDQAEPHEANTLKLDCSKIRNALGWHPILSVEESIKWIVAWAQSYFGKENLKEVTLQQIQTFESLVRGVELE